MLSTTVLLVFLFFSPPEGTAFSTSQRSHHVARHSVPFERAQFHGDFHKRVHAVAQIGKPSSDYSISKVSPFRIAILLVWYGPNSAPKNIEFFLSSVAANANLVDLLLFHEGNSALEKTVSNAGQKNVHLINLGPNGFTSLVAEKLGISLLSLLFSLLPQRLSLSLCVVGCIY